MCAGGNAGRRGAMTLCYHLVPAVSSLPATAWRLGLGGAGWGLEGEEVGDLEVGVGVG